MKRAAAAFVLCAALLLGQPAPASAQTLEIATDQSPVGLDPHIATSFATQLITSTVYEGLTAIDANLHVVPALAESWTVSPDGLTYVFQLRTASFHNGRKMTPADIVASVARVQDPKTGSPFASRFTGITSVQPEGASAVRFTLAQPSAPFLGQLASLAIVPPEAIGELARHPVGTGPFVFREWVPDTAITLDRNPAYWEQNLPHLAGLKFDIVPEAATRQIGLQSGTYGMVASLDAATATALANQTRVKLLQTQDLAYSLIGLNVSRPPFDKPEVREAVNLAIDRAQLVDAAYYGRAVPAGPLSPALTEWALPVTAFSCYRPDPAQSRKLLQQAGLTLPVKITLNVLGSLQQVVDVAQVVQAQMNKAGFEVTLNVQEQGRFIQDWRGGNFQAFASLNGGGTDPDDYFGRTFATGGATNVFKYSDPALDKMLADARASQDPAARKTIYEAAQRKLACEGPAVHLAYGTLFTAIRADLKSYQPNPTRSLRGLRDASIGPDMLRRLGGLGVVAFGVSILTFLMIRLIPGDAVQIMIGANAEVTPQQIALVRARLGLDQPILTQYLAWTGRALHGDLGTSVWTGRPVLQEILPRIGVTAELTLLALLVATLLAVPLGCLMATATRRWSDYTIRFLSIAGITMPSFWIGTLLLYFVSALLPNAQMVGWVPFADDPWGNLQRSILPVTALALPVMATLSRILRAAMIEAMRQDYVRTARAKGLPEWTVIAVHALRNALIPFLTSFGIMAGYLFGGSVVVEQVFAIPGLGRLMVGAIVERNYPLVQASILLATLAFVLVNALVDLLAAAADPRIGRA